MVRIATPFVAGVLAGIWFAPGIDLALLTLLLLTPAAALVLLFPSKRRARWQRGLVLSTWFLCAGLSWKVMNEPRNHPRHYERFAERDGPWALRITAINGTSDKVLRADARLEGRVGDQGLVPRTGPVMVTLMHHPERPTPVIGDRLLVDAHLDPIARNPDPGGFDRRAWAASRGMVHELFAPAERWRPVDHVPHWTGVFSHTRERIANWLHGSDLEQRERALVKALVLGQRDELDSEQREAFARSGTIHVLAVSGMHVGLIFAMLSFLFGWWGGGPRARYMRGLCILLALWCYAGLTGASPSVLRATIMFSLFTLANMAAQRTDHLNSLFAAAFVLLLWEPRMLGQIGFQLSFLAVLGIILFYKPFERLWSPESKILRAIWSLAVVSLSAQMLTTPVSLHLFKAFPVWFLPANIVVVTAVGLAVNGSVALLVLYKVPVLGAAITWVLSMLLKGVGLVTGFVSELPGAYPEVRVGPLAVVLLYLLILSLAAWWQWGWRSMRWMTAAAGAALLFSWGTQARQAHERGSFVVYDDRERTLAAMTHGRHFVLRADGAHALEDPWVARKLARHQRTEGLHDPVALPALHSGGPVRQGPTVVAAGLWRSPRIQVAFHSDVQPWDGPLNRTPLDAVVLHDLGRIDTTALARWKDSRHLVLASGVAWRVRRVVGEWCGQHGVQCHDVRRDGAFVISR
jgi:competence protein ComEC